MEGRWQAAGREGRMGYNHIVMGCCCHEKNYSIDTDLIDEHPHKVSLSPSNQLTSSIKESHQLLPHQVQKAEDELRQSPILCDEGQQLWAELQNDEADEGDLLRVTHTNNMPISVENSMRKRAENMPLVDVRSTCPQPRIILTQAHTSGSFPTVPKITFGPLSTIRQEESSLNDTHHKSVNQISASECSQRGDMRRMF